MNTKIILFTCFLSILQIHLAVGILGGEPANIGQFPSVVALIVISDIDVNVFIVFCSGTIIDQLWVLTTGRCVNDIGTKYPLKNVFVRAGVVNIRQFHPFMQTLKIVFYEKHKDYVLTDAINRNDIGLIKVANDGFRLNKYVAIYPLFTKEHEELGGKGDIAGWGLTSDDSDALPSDTLNTLTVDIFNLAKCQHLLIKLFRSKKKIFSGYLLTEQHLCTGPLIGEKAACAADFGTPLIQKNSTGHDEVLALVSYMFDPCGAKDSPTMYTKVSSYINWIDTIKARN